MRMHEVLRSWSTALVAVAALAGCGGIGSSEEGRDIDQEFRDRLQVIVEAASARYGELAEVAGGVNPDQPMPEDFRAQMRAVAVSDRGTADEIEALTPPVAAAETIRMLVDALRARADVFEEAAGRATLTMQQLEAERSITDAGERIDQALRQLREEGFLAEEEPHD